MDAVINPLRPEDAAAGAELARAEGLISVQTPWLEAHIDANRDRPELALGAWVGDDLVGVSVATDLDPYAFLGPLAVAGAYQSQGIGSALLEASCTALSDRKPLVLEATDSGSRLYGRRGFRPSWQTARWATSAAHSLSAPSELLTGDMRKFGSIDQVTSGADRIDAASLLLQLDPELTVVSHGSAVALLGPNKLLALSGSNDSDILHLLDGACARYDELACWARDLAPVRAALEDRGFSQVPNAPVLTRMVREGDEPTSRDRIWTLLSIQAG